MTKIALLQLRFSLEGKEGNNMMNISSVGQTNVLYILTLRIFVVICGPKILTANCRKNLHQ